MKLREILIVIMLIGLAGCGPNSGNHPAASEQTEETVKMLLTGYGPDLEVFAEADPFVAGEPGNILAHFTWLTDFKPVDSSSVTVRLISGENTVSQTLEGPVRKGIYSFDITPVTTGTGKLVFLVNHGSVVHELEVTPVTVSPDKETAHSRAEENRVSTANAIAFTKEQSWKVDFATSPAEMREFGQVIKTVAQVHSALNEEVMITARANGTVSFSGNNVIEGMMVRSGMPLFSISGAGIAESNSAVVYAEARNNYLRTKADYERQLELADEKIVSEKELLETKNIYDNARSRFESMSDNFSLSGEVVSSPVSGYVSHLYVTNGQFVEAGESIISISANNSMLLTADISQKDAAVAPEICSAVLRNPGTGETLTLEEMNGKVLAWGRNTNRGNYMIPISLQIPGRKGFIPGGLVEVWLKTSSDEKNVVVPNTSLIEEQGNFFVFVQITPELFEKREIKMIATDGLFTSISAGLIHGERIVTRGALMVKLSQASGALDPHAGHVH